MLLEVGFDAEVALTQHVRFWWFRKYRTRSSVLTVLTRHVRFWWFKELWWLVGEAFVYTVFTLKYLDWAWAAPSSEPGQVREEAAIRDR